MVGLLGSIAKTVADAKSELLGDAAEEYNTLGKLEDKIIAAENAAKAAATIVEKRCICYQFNIKCCN